MTRVAEIEQAIISELKTTLTYFKKVSTLAEFLQMSADNLAVLTPAAYVTYAGGSYKPRGMTTDRFDREMQFAIIVVCRNPISQARLLHGTPVREGVYEIIEDVVAALKGRTLGLDIQPLEPLSDNAMDGDTVTAVYGITFGTKGLA